VKLLKTIFLLHLIFIPTMNAQSLSVGLGGGFSSMQPERYESFTYQNSSFNNYTWSGKFVELKDQKNDQGLNYSGYFRYGLPILPVNIIAGFQYCQYTGSAGNVTVESPPWSSLMYTNGVLKTKKEMVSINVGVQWEISSSFITPYLSFQAMANRFSETSLEIKTNFGNLYEEAKTEKKSRYGAAVGAGAKVNLLPGISSNLEINYSANNISPREDAEKAINSVSLNLLFFYQLF